MAFHRKRSGHKNPDTQHYFTAIPTSTLHDIHMDIDMSHLGLTHFGEGLCISIRFQKTPDAPVSVILDARQAPSGEGDTLPRGSTPLLDKLVPFGFRSQTYEKFPEL